MYNIQACRFTYNTNYLNTTGSGNPSEWNAETDGANTIAVVEALATSTGTSARYDDVTHSTAMAGHIWSYTGDGVDSSNSGSVVFPWHVLGTMVESASGNALLGSYSHGHIDIQLTALDVTSGASNSTIVQSFDDVDQADSTHHITAQASYSDPGKIFKVPMTFYAGHVYRSFIEIDATSDSHATYISTPASPVGFDAASQVDFFNYPNQASVDYIEYQILTAGILPCGGG